MLSSTVYRLLIAVTFSGCETRALGSRASAVAARTLGILSSQALEEQDLWSTGLLFHCMLDLPGPGIDHVSPAAAAVSHGEAQGEFIPR